MQSRHDRLPVEARSLLRIDLEVTSRMLTILECRPPWRPDMGMEWTRCPAARLRYTQIRREWSLYRPDRNSKFHHDGLIPPSPNVAGLLKEIDRDPTCIFWGCARGPSTVVKPEPSSSGMSTTPNPPGFVPDKEPLRSAALVDVLLAVRVATAWSGRLWRRGLWDRPREALDCTPSGFADSDDPAFRINGVQAMAARPELQRSPKGRYDGLSPLGANGSIQETATTTSHFCKGKWKPGPIEECPKHTRLSKKQISVYRSRDAGDTPSGSGGDRSGSSGGSRPDSG